MEKNVLTCDTVTLDDGASSLVIIDQTKLPNALELLALKTQAEIWEAIRSLKVRGAPAIGVAAAYGLYLAAKEIETASQEEFLVRLRAAADYLNGSRPTAVNLSWALWRMMAVAESACQRGEGVPEVRQRLLAEATRIQEEDIEICRKIGAYGLSLLRPGDGIITHCNAGKLAASRYGTATAPLYLGHAQGYGFRVFCDETRPLLQGARLTAFELMAAGMDVTLIGDGMAASVMKKGWANAVITGCDRVAANGDAANKIGTLPLAIAARHFGIPFYLCAPSSTIDLDTPCGGDICIEERDAEELTTMWYEKPMAPPDVKVFNPAFDVTDASLITGIITERGILYPPYGEALAKLMGHQGE